jgi:hypothetical protein
LAWLGALLQDQWPARAGLLLLPQLLQWARIQQQELLAQQRLMMWLQLLLGLAPVPG